MQPYIHKDGLYRFLIDQKIDLHYLNAALLALHPLYLLIEKGFNWIPASSIDVNAVSKALSFLSGKENKVRIFSFDQIRNPKFPNKIEKEKLEKIEYVSHYPHLGEFCRRLNCLEGSADILEVGEGCTLFDKIFCKPLRKLQSKNIDNLLEDSLYEACNEYPSVIFLSNMKGMAELIVQFAVRKNMEAIEECKKCIEIISSHLVIGISDKTDEWILIAP